MREIGATCKQTNIWKETFNITSTHLKTIYNYKYKKLRAADPVTPGTDRGLYRRSGTRGKKEISYITTLSLDTLIKISRITKTIKLKNE